MGNCSTNCNPCGPSYDAINSLASKTASYARQALSAVTTVEEFQSLYLGAKAEAPTTDNEGNPLIQGALYFNTTDGEMYVWAGSAWELFGQAGYYLGAKASDPTTDNEGNPLVAGLLYFNTTSNVMRVYNGTFWQNVAFDESTPFLATGTTAPRNLVDRFADVVNVRDFGAVGDGVADDTVAIQTADLYASTNKKQLIFTSGTYKINTDYTFLSSVFMNGGIILSEYFISFQNGFDANDYYCLQTRISSMPCKKNVRWFGAIGDGSGRTPADDGIDIESEPWNTWDRTEFKDNTSWSPYATTGSFIAPNTTPFTNQDTWDYIGISMALWFASGSTYIPDGNYSINTDVTWRGGYRGLLIMKGMEGEIVGDGPHNTNIITKENASFFNANNVGVDGYYKLFSFYRTGPKPTYINNLRINGPVSYNSASLNLNLITCINANQVNFRELWIVACSKGLSMSDGCTDCSIERVTSEYCFASTIYCINNSEIYIDFCNFWRSSGSVVANQKGIVTDGKVLVNNTRFIGFYYPSIEAESGQITNCYFQSNTTGNQKIIILNNNGLISSCFFEGSTNGPMIKVIKDISLIGNYFNQGGQHACIECGDGTAASATNLTISGNTFIKTNSTAGPQNYNITALQSGVNYSGAATPSLFITGNTFQGNTLNPLGTASIKNNVINGVYTA